jgi:hypothetical protein
MKEIEENQNEKKTKGTDLTSSAASSVPCPFHTASFRPIRGRQ